MWARCLEKKNRKEQAVVGPFAQKPPSTYLHHLLSSNTIPGKEASGHHAVYYAFASSKKLLTSSKPGPPDIRANRSMLWARPKVLLRVRPGASMCASPTKPLQTLLWLLEERS